MTKLHPAAYWMAKTRWPQISEKTQYIKTERSAVIIPALAQDDRSLWERWTEEVAMYAVFEQERIELDRVRVPEMPELQAMGYGSKTDVLAYRVRRAD